MNYPSPWSQFFRLMGGVSHSSVADRSRTSSLFGVGYGATRYLHKNLDLRAEVRLGYTHQIFTQTTIGLEIKVDDWVESFVKKIKDLGLDAVHGAGEVLSAPFRGQEQEKRTE